MKIIKNINGFTLIELLIVVAIIAILAAIAIPNFLQAQVRAKVSRTQADMQSVATGLESYYVDNNSYPWTDFGAFNRLQRLMQLTTPISYLSSVPQDAFNVTGDPFQNKVYPYWDPPYVYELAGLNADGTGNPSGEWFQLTQDLYDRVVIDRQLTWILLSYGPDQDYAPASFGQTQIYNPTNGTVSNGDIMRWGP